MGDDLDNLAPIVIRRPPKPTVQELAWALVNTVILNLALAAIAAIIIAACWNGLTDLTTLPEIDWREAFAAVILLRTAALTARL